MDYIEARQLAERVCHQLVPYCEKIRICGSIRRRKAECHDIDIVTLPKTEPVKDLFGFVTGHQRLKGFIDTINQWEKLKGDPTGKYTQRLFEGRKLEIAIASPINYGNLVLIRTGNSDFSHMVMTATLKRGFQQKDGFLWRDNKIIPVHEEDEYFKIIGIPFVAPEFRDKNAYYGKQA